MEIIYIDKSKQLENYCKDRGFCYGIISGNSELFIYKNHNNINFQYKEAYVAVKSPEEEQYLYSEFIKRGIRDILIQIARYNCNQELLKVESNIHSELYYELKDIGVLKETEYTKEEEHSFDIEMRHSLRTGIAVETNLGCSRNQTTSIPWESMGS